MGPSWGCCSSLLVHLVPSNCLDDRLDTDADKALIDKELDKDIYQSIYTLKSAFYLEHLKNEENLEEIEKFIDLFEKSNKTQEEVEQLSKCFKTN